MNLTDFNDLPPHEAAGVLRPCADIPRWIDSIVSRRPYASEADLFAEAASAAPDWTEAEIKQALSHHPRIGEPPRLPTRGRSSPAWIPRTRRQPCWPPETRRTNRSSDASS